MGKRGKTLRQSTASAQARRAVIFAAVLAAFAFAAASANAAPLVWTVNKDAGVVSTIETGTNKIVGAPIAVGERPESIAITPNGRIALVSNYDGKSVSVIDTVAHAVVATIPLSGHPGQVAISPSGKFAYVEVEGVETAVIDPVAGKIVGSVSVTELGSPIAFTPDGTRAYVSSGGEAVQAVDTGTGLPVGPPIPTGKFPESIVFTPNGKTAYVSSTVSKLITVINVALGQAVASIPFAGDPMGLAISPNGLRLYVADELNGAVSVYETEGNHLVGKPIPTGTETQYIAITPDGKTAYVSAAGEETVTPIELATDEASKPIKFAGETADLAVAPDQSPTAVFTAPSTIAGYATSFSGTASTDPDGSVALWNWSFGDGVLGTGATTSHTYGAPGTYGAKLSVVDNEGCGEAEVFTGRTAYCSGNPTATVTHPVTVASTPVVCSSRFGIGGVVHNRRNGTVRLRVRLPATGSLVLFGKQVHAVTRKVRKAGTMMLTVHARVELNKRLKKVHHASVRVRISFWPSAGCGPTTVHRSFALLRAAKKKAHQTR
jgi:YVTN family beta-propeller protein